MFKYLTKTLKLKDIGVIYAGGTPSTEVKEYWGGEINWLNSGAVQNRVINEDSVIKKITKIGLEKSAAKLIPSDSVLLAITGATCANVGYLTFDSATNQSIISITPNKLLADSKFVFYLLINSRKEILRLQGGSAQGGVTLNDIKNLEVSLPSLKEQQIIGSFLSAIDKMIELKQKTLSLFNRELDYKINYIIKKINLKSFNKNKIEELFKISVGGDIPKEGYSENKDQIFKYPIFSNSLVNNGLYGYSKTFTKLKNSITVTGRGEVGKAVVRRENYYPIVRLLSLTPMNELDLNYFAYIINKINIFNDQTGVPQLTAPKLSNYEIFYVSDINIQRKIGKIIEEKERVINLYQKQIIEFQKYKSYYLDQIFNKGDKNAKSIKTTS
jgi:type I restriction enzyme S subunit